MERNLYLSIVIPAYNESTRLPQFLAGARSWLDLNYAKRYQVLVVDDGGDDSLNDHLQAAFSPWTELVLIRHEKNLGKGAAIKTGLGAAEGDFILLTDADGATPIANLARLLAAAETGNDMVVGSRLGWQVSRARLRGCAGRIFVRIVHWLFDLPVRDTQCGFKLMNLSLGKLLSQMCREDGYLFDIEAIAVACRLGFRVCEVHVPWTEMPGSKVSLWKDGTRMLLGLFRIRRRLASLDIDFSRKQSCDQQGCDASRH